METLVMFMSMAARLSVFKEVRCWLMPERMASASLSCFLQPAQRTRSPMAVIKYAARFMRISSSLPITHSQHHHNVTDGEDSKGITELAVDDVPKIKHLLGPGQE